jgi:hypothetical protein
VFPPRYFVHMEEVHGNGNSFFSPYTPELAQLVPGFSTPRSIHEIRSKKHLGTILGEVPYRGGLRHGRFSNIWDSIPCQWLIEPTMPL